MQEIQRYKAEDINVSQCHPEGSDVLKYWCLKKAKYPTLAVIARALLGFAVSAAGIQRNFCSAGSTITVRRNSLDNAIAEMMLFLYLNPVEIPALEHVKELSDNIALGVLIPVRFRVNSIMLYKLSVVMI